MVKIIQVATVPSVFSFYVNQQDQTIIWYCFLPQHPDGTEKFVFKKKKKEKSPFSFHFKENCQCWILMLQICCWTVTGFKRWMTLEHQKELMENYTDWMNIYINMYWQSWQIQNNSASEKWG